MASSILAWFREAPWLTHRRLVAYPKLFLAGYAVSGIVWLLLSNGLVDRSGNPIGADFVEPWSASWLTLHGAPAAVYDLARLWAVERSAIAYPAFGFVSFLYPPMYLLIVLPLALLPYLWSLIVWTVATFAAYLGVLWKIDPERDSLWLAIAFPGALINLANGQNGFLTFALLGAALLTLERRPILAGVLFGLMSYKPQYGVLVPIFLLATGRWRAIAAASVTVVLFAALSIATFGEKTWQSFFATVSFSRHFALEQGASGFEKLQSVFAAARLWGLGVAPAYAFQTAVSLIAAITVIWIWRRTAKLDLHAAALATGMLLVTPYIMDYDMVVLALPIAWLALEGRRSGFLPWEKSLLAFVWLLPLFARLLAGRAMIPLGPLAMLLLLGDISRRAASTPRCSVPPPASS
ncbi:MAG TPA: glycosyltransferase family 87 protein [Candidatus Binataceae bacterium]